MMPDAKVSLEFCALILYNIKSLNAGVMELVDVTDSKSVGSDTVWVRVPPPAPQLPLRAARHKGEPFFQKYTLRYTLASL